MKNCLKNYMKKGIILSLVLTFAFPVSSYAEVNNEEAGGPNLELISQLHLKEQLAENEAELEEGGGFNVEKIDEDKLKFNKEDADILDNGVTGERMAVSEVHDSVEGYLAAAEDSHVYGLQIQPGVLLQAQLEQPDVSALDYDLYIFDSTGVNILDGSENYTYINSNGKTCPEGAGIINTSNAYQTYYIMVRSSAGGSSTSPYTLRYSVSYPFDSNEADENVMSAKTFTVNSGGFLLNTRNISSPVDADWYKVTIPSSKAYDEVTVAISGAPNKLELYKDATGYNKMLLLDSAESGKNFTRVLPAGEYYIRVSYNGPDDSFDSDNVNNYRMMLKPLLKATDIIITKYESDDPNSNFVSYPQGYYFRAPGYVKFTGLVYSTDPVTGDEFVVPGTKVEMHMYDVAQENPDFYHRHGETETDENGIFEKKLSFGPSQDTFSYVNSHTIAYYDWVMVQANILGQSDIKYQSYVYHLGYIHFSN